MFFSMEKPLAVSLWPCPFVIPWPPWSVCPKHPVRSMRFKRDGYVPRGREREREEKRREESERCARDEVDECVCVLACTPGFAVCGSTAVCVQLPPTMVADWRQLIGWREIIARVVLLASFSFLFPVSGPFLL